MTTIDVAKHFARYPFGRYRDDGDYSGQRFREEFLTAALRQDDEPVVVVLDGAVGLGSSFLEEAFGGLIRQGFDRTEVQRRIKIVSQRDETLAREIAGYIADVQTPEVVETPRQFARA